MQVGNHDLALPTHEWTGSEHRGSQQRQHGISMIKKPFAALYLDSLGRKVVREQSYAFERSGGREIFGADPVTSKEVVGGNEVQMDITG